MPIAVTIDAAPTTPAELVRGGGAPLRRDWDAIGLSIAVFAGLSLAASIFSEGFLEADGCTHYLYARFAFEEPHYLVNIWGRPICTAVYAIPALLAGRFGVRTASLCMAIGIALLTYLIARRQGYRRPALALVFTLAQPLVFLHSFSELTELPFALLLSLAFIAYQGRRWMYLTLLVSILPLSRPEGFGVIALTAAALALHRKWVWLLVLPVPLIVWNYAGWSLYGFAPYPWYQWLSRNWPYAERSAYESGSIAHFVMLLPAVVSPILFPATILGIWRSIQCILFNCTVSCQAKVPVDEDRAHGLEAHVTTESIVTRASNPCARRYSPRNIFIAGNSSLIDRCQVLIAVIPLLILAGHSLLYATGRMASSGEVRYMLVVAPFWALLSAKGWEWFFESRRLRHEMMAALIASIAPAFVNYGYQVLPLAFTEDWTNARTAVEWVKRTPLSHDYPRVATSHPGFFYFMNVSPTDRYRVIEWRKQNIENPPKGAMMLWDWVYGTHNSDADRVIPVDEILRAGWVPIDVPCVMDGTRDAPPSRRVFLSPLDINGRPTAERFGVKSDATTPATRDSLFHP